LFSCIGVQYVLFYMEYKSRSVIDGSAIGPW